MPQSQRLQPSPAPDRQNVWQALPPIKAVLWRATDLPRNVHPTVPTGHAALDAALPGGGWPTHSLTEILTPQPAVLEWRLLGPAWRRLSSGRPLVWIAPPHCPHLPGLQHAGVRPDQLIWVQAHSAAERLWAAEQVIKSNDFGALMVWLPQARAEQLRRLQVCAQAAEGLVFAWRPAVSQWSPSAAPLRALVTAGTDWDLQVHLFKRQGPAHDSVLHLPCVPDQLGTLMTPKLAHPRALFAKPLAGAMSAPTPTQATVLSAPAASSRFLETPHAVDRPVPDSALRLNRRCLAAH